ncbi:hypothetical protein GCM10023082_23550 [Streptomyces tremellae]|uniref:Uncharacterized protein n=1 Tax=Streptomyces tremellae TaxID=1124239 RepID=A0ABP7EU33_9ACTN
MGPDNGQLACQTRPPGPMHLIVPAVLDHAAPAITRQVRYVPVNLRAADRLPAPGGAT